MATGKPVHQQSCCFESDKLFVSPVMVTMVTTLNDNTETSLQEAVDFVSIVCDGLANEVNEQVSSVPNVDRLEVCSGSHL